MPGTLCYSPVAAWDLCAMIYKRMITCSRAETHLLLFIVHERNKLVYQGWIVMHCDHMDRCSASGPFFVSHRRHERVPDGRVVFIFSEREDHGGLKPSKPDLRIVRRPIPCQIPGLVTQIGWPLFRERLWSEYESFEPMTSSHYS